MPSLGTCIPTAWELGRVGVETCLLVSALLGGRTAKPSPSLHVCIRQGRQIATNCRSVQSPPRRGRPRRWNRERATRAGAKNYTYVGRRSRAPTSKAWQQAGHTRPWRAKRVRSASGVRAVQNSFGRFRECPAGRDTCGRRKTREDEITGCRYNG